MIFVDHFEKLEYVVRRRNESVCRLKRKDSIGVMWRAIGFSDPNDPRKVIVKKLALCVVGRPDVELDLTGNLSQLKKQTFVIKEGVSYRIRIDFIVQREIVHGLKYVQKTFRLGVLGNQNKNHQNFATYFPPHPEKLYSLYFSRQNDPHGWLLSPEKRDTIVHDTGWGCACRNDSAWFLYREFVVHGRRQARAPQLGMVVRHQKRLERLEMANKRKNPLNSTSWLKRFLDGAQWEIENKKKPKRKQILRAWEKAKRIAKILNSHYAKINNINYFISFIFVPQTWLLTNSCVVR